MKKLIVLLCLMCFLTVSHASKLSKFFKDLDKEDRARQEREWQKDMNFGDFSFRLDKRYIDDRGQHCRDYKFRARSNPYRHGYYTVCEEH
ncbi:hypothetical protein ACD661_03445 [Legionella lytica]|uniref:Uncharacterized protein n=1 Tax=Legionella lytica TaxID=96232 RepID=A0ABW8D7Y7_9GAMM